MSNKKDPRRLNLIVPYQEPKPKTEPEFSSTVTSMMPMAAMLTRNRYIGWSAVIYSLLSWMGESEEASKSATPGYFNVGMSFMALVVTYIPIFMPQPGQTTDSAGPAQPVAVA